MTKKGYKQTKEHKMKKSISLKNYYKNNKSSKCGFQKGRKYTKEENLKKSLRMKGHKTSEETKKKIGTSNSIALKKYFSKHTSWNKGLTKANDNRVLKGSLLKKGRTFTENQRKSFVKYWESKLGKHNSIESNKKRSLKLKGRNLGIPRTEETKQKIKESRKYIIVPKKDTTIEIRIQNFLKQLNIEFFTHQYMQIEHGYQCDILIPSLNLVIECDGDYWHKYPVGNDIDHIRTSELIEKGFKVLRLWEVDIRKMDLDEFKGRIEC